MAELYDCTASIKITEIVESCELAQEVVKVQNYSPSGIPYIQILGKPRKSYNVTCSVTRSEKRQLEQAEANGNLIRIAMSHGTYYGYISELSFSTLPENYFTADLTLLAWPIFPDSLNGVGFEKQPLSTNQNQPTLIYRDPSTSQQNPNRPWYAYATGKAFVVACTAADAHYIYFGSKTSGSVYEKYENGSWSTKTLSLDSTRGIYIAYDGGASTIGSTEVIPIYSDEDEALDVLEQVVKSL